MATSINPADKTAKEQIDLLISAVDDLNPPQEKQLVKELEQALKELAKGKTKQACQALDQFIKQVQQLVKRNQLSLGAGDDLIDAANQIKTALGCP